MIHNVWLIVFLLVMTVVNIIVPLPGSSVVTPVVAALLDDPLKAIGLISIYFFLSGVIRAYVFREFIVWPQVKQFLPLSVVFAILGALSLLNVSHGILYALLFIFVFWSLIKVVRKVFFEQELKPQGKLAAGIVAVISGFLQGTGLSGSDMRNSFFYADGLNIQQTHGTGAFISIFIFGAATITRFSTNQLNASDTWFFLFAIPILLLGTWLGKIVILKIPKNIQNYLICLILIGVLVTVGIKIAKFV